jgi:nucleoside-diphosphate-sugar epimerase
MIENLNGKTILLTGASGFIGSTLVKKLLKAGAKVIGVDNFITGRPQNLSSIMSADLSPLVENFHFVQADVSQEVGTYLTDLPEVDVVLHFASPASPPKYQKYPVETYLVNSVATHHLLEFLKNHNPQARFVFASTSEVYGDPQVHPQTEEYWGNVNPNGKRSCYDESKRLGETIAGVFYRDFGMDTRIVRIFNTYGPAMDPTDGRVIPNFIMQALKKEPFTIYGDGDYTRSYCYVDDLVEFIIRTASLEGLAGETINIGNPQEYSVMQTAEIIHKLINGDDEIKIENFPLPADDPTRRKPDISKAQKLLDYTPRFSFEEGLVPTIEYFKTTLL